MSYKYLFFYSSASLKKISVLVLSELRQRKMVFSRGSKENTFSVLFSIKCAYN